MRLLVKRLAMTPVVAALSLASMPVIPFCAMATGCHCYGGGGVMERVGVRMAMFAAGCLFALVLPLVAVWWCWTEME